MRKISLVLLLVVAVMGVSAGYRRRIPRGCPAREVYQSCGTACPPTCENPNPQVCTLQCVLGCFCRDGFVRDIDDSCVRPWECSNVEVVNS